MQLQPDWPGRVKPVRFMIIASLPASPSPDTNDSCDTSRKATVSW